MVKKLLKKIFVRLPLLVLAVASAVILMMLHTSAATSGQMILYLHKEASDVNETYNALALTKPEPQSYTASGTGSTTNANATPPTSFCQASTNTSNTYNQVSVSGGNKTTGNRCVATFISQPVGQAITMSTSDTSAISGVIWSSRSSTSLTVAPTLYIYRWTSGTTVTSANRIATLTGSTPGTTATQASLTATAPANNITFAATDRIIIIATLNITANTVNNATSSMYFDNSSVAASQITLKYTPSTPNKPSLTGSLDDDFTTGTATSSCTTSGLTVNTKWTCLQGSATNSTGTVNEGALSGTIGGDTSGWIKIDNSFSAAGTSSNFGTTPSNTFLYQTLPAYNAAGTVRTVVNSTANFTIGSTNAASPYNHVGLVLWTSNTDYLEVQLFSDATVNGTASTVNVALNNSGTLSGTTGINNPASNGKFSMVWLGFSYDGNGNYQAQYSVDGTTWNNIGSPVAHANFTRTGLNAFTALGSVSGDYAGAFEWFQYTFQDVSYNQTSYQWLINADSVTPAGKLNSVAQNTPTTLTSTGEQFRLRQLIKPSASITSGSQSFNEQYAGLGSYGSCSAIPSGSWNSMTPNTWTEATSGANWVGRSDFASAVFNNKLWVMGGTSGSGYLNDVWYSSDGVTWTEATANANWPGREGLNAAVFNNKLWIFGGYSGSYLNDVWYSSDGVTWTEATANANWPGRYEFASAVFNNELWVMGGTSGSGYLNDVWYSSDGVTWTEATANANWTVRAFFNADVFNNKLWVMGGTNGINGSNDVWYSSDGVTWTEATANANWPGRYEFASAVFNNELWVMGGVSGSGDVNDVWYSSDGVTWTEATANANWTVRQSLNADAFNNKLWVMGGVAVSYYNDVWYTGLPTIAYYNNPTPASGAAISATANDPTESGQTVSPQTYQEADNFTTTSTIGGTVDGEWDLSIYDNGAPANTTYCFRTVKADGTALDTYTNYPMITTAPSTDQFMRGGELFNNGAKQPFFWAQ